MADALALVGLPFTHVSQVLPAGNVRHHGQSSATDPEIARWCGQTEHVLVSADEDFRGRWVRSGLLAQHGVEVICFDHELAGLVEQHRRITALYERWEEELGVALYQHRVWIQGRRQRPFLAQGKAVRARARRPGPTRAPVPRP